MYNKIDRDEILKSFVEITLPDDDAFLKIRETLTRIGIPSRKENILYQSCHIFHKKGKFYIVHFKELFLLDGKANTLDSTDIKRRNAIAKLLEDWDLLTILDSKKVQDREHIGSIKILSHAEKSKWELLPKYSIGKKK